MRLIEPTLTMLIGPMFSGKSTELIRRVNRYSIAGYKPLVVKPALDTRTSNITSRSGTNIECITLKSAKELCFLIEDNIDDIDIIAIDEAQFFNSLYDTIYKVMADYKKPVLLAGLDMDFRGMPFGDIPRLVTLATEVQKFTAICNRCKSDKAIYSHRRNTSKDIVLIGDADNYEPLCFSCYHKETTHESR